MLLSKLIMLVKKFFSIIKYLDRYSQYYFYYDKYDISKTFIFSGRDIELYGGGVIKINGPGYCGNRTVIQSVQGCKVVIGSNVSISHNVRIYTSSRNPQDIVSQRQHISYIEMDVLIGDNCWIGANVFINPGVVIGNNSVVGANSVVTKNIPPNSVFAGCPAKKIG
ncbi:hypothetical protein NLG07_07825 [Alteromonas sp. LMIT006]|uniref:acyltransferase n=1 Tax=Alteromonadaceae TaxID=72275 RepID=UPI0020CA7353|nr:DapH/DapD/GlmU-related protein [Alteromonas sp. LMIT006]UTP71918.1 hypothetical protein NLG07_07825 [Alteromonas sp. LMIT006]